MEKKYVIAGAGVLGVGLVGWIILKRRAPASSADQEGTQASFAAPALMYSPSGVDASGGAGGAGGGDLPLPDLGSLFPSSGSGSNSSTSDMLAAFMASVLGSQTKPTTQPTTPTTTKPTTAPSAFQTWLKGIYSGTLERDVDTSGASYWEEKYKAGTSLDTIAQGIAHSTENANQEAAKVKALYQSILGRDADSGGLETWTQSLVSGQSVDYVKQQISNSSEAQVQNLYHSLLGRDADAGGMATWTQALASGQTVDQVKAQIQASDEAKAKAKA